MSKRLPMSSKALSILRECGWVTVNSSDESDEHILSAVKTVARQLGKPIADRGSDLFQVLKPTEQHEAQLSSLSAKFGTGELPLHMDTAHWTTPCRYVVLACLKPGKTPAPTHLYDCISVPFGDEENRVLREGLFHVKNGAKSFYSTVASSMRSYFRFDPGCMFPLNSAAKEAAQIFNQRFEFSLKYDWKRGALLVLDNWRVLHGRAEASEKDNGRLLLRGLIV